jgi:hypothetical protein
MRRRRALLVLLAIAIITVWLVQPRYYLTESGGAQLLCDADHCYLFAGYGRAGWKGTNLRYIGELFVSALGGAVPPTHQRGETIVFILDKEGIQRRSFAGSLSPNYIYHGNLYVSYVTDAARHRSMRTLGRDIGQRGKDYFFGKWNGSNIEPVSAEEEKVVVTATDMWYVLKEKSAQDGVWRGNFEGWTWVHAIPPEHPVRVDLTSGDLVFTARSDQWPGEKSSLAVKTAQGNGTVLLSIDGSPRRITAVEYEQFFVGDTSVPR